MAQAPPADGISMVQWCLAIDYCKPENFRTVFFSRMNIQQSKYSHFKPFILADLAVSYYKSLQYFKFHAV